MPAAWPVAKLRNYLTAIVVLSCAPLALLMAWIAGQDLRDREERLLRSLQDSSRALAALVEADLTASADWLDMLAASGLAQRLAAPGSNTGDAGLRRAGWHSVFVE